MYMCPGSIHLLGYIIDGKMYFDVTLSMGSRSAAFCCQRMTNAVTHIFKEEVFQNINYLDDLGGAEEEELAEVAFQVLGQILEKIGIKESKSKAVLTGNVVIFLGILFNTITKTLTITPDRLAEIKQLVKMWLKKGNNQFEGVTTIARNT